MYLSFDNGYSGIHLHRPRQHATGNSDSGNNMSNADGFFQMPMMRPPVFSIIVHVIPFFSYQNTSAKHRHDLRPCNDSIHAPYLSLTDYASGKCRMSPHQN